MVYQLTRACKFITLSSEGAVIIGRSGNLKETDFKECSDIYCVYHLYVLCVGPEAGMIGLETTSYSVNENDGEVEVCVNTSSSRSCPFPFAFNVTLSTKDDTAGTYIVVSI